MTTDLEHLVSLFPQRSREELALALEAHGNDVERTAAYLLDDAEHSEAPFTVDLSDPWETATATQVANDHSADRSGSRGHSSTLDAEAEENASSPAGQATLEDEALARQLQSEYDREWAEALSTQERNRSTVSGRSASIRSGTVSQHPRVDVDHSLGAEVREALGQAQETVSQWWHSLKGTVQSWMSERESAGRSSQRYASEDPMLGPPHNYAVPEAMSEERSEGVTEESVSTDPRWSQSEGDPILSTASLYHRVRPDSSPSHTSMSFSKKDM